MNSGLDTRPLGEAAERLRDEIRRGVELARPALAELGRQVAGFGDQLAAFFHDYDPARWHRYYRTRRRHCERCIPPFAHPKPCPVDGHAYRRRQRARVRRRR